jgi:signal transduction histidine kinase
MDPQLAAAERDEAARIIHGNGEPLLTILNDVLDLSKIEVGRMEFERVPCSPREIMADVATLMKERAARASTSWYPATIPFRERFSLIPPGCVRSSSISSATP